MNTFELTLDLDKSVGVKQWITLRQGDKRGTTLQATLYDHGVLVSGSYTCRVSIRHPNRNTYYRETATYSNGVATVTIDETSAASVVGVTEGYFELLQGSTLIASTESFGVRVLQSATDGATVGPPYDSAIQDALDELDAATGRISQMVVDATAEYLAAHPEITTTVQDNSVTDAKLIQSGGVLDRVGRLWWRLENLLTNTPSEAESVTVSDAAQTPVAGLTVFGKSTQDGTPAPDAPVAIQSVTPNLAKGYAATVTNNGITYVTTEGGATTISGTASNGSSMPLQTAGTFALPAGTYTLVMGGELAASGTGVRAQLTKVTGSSISNVSATAYTTGGGTVSVTFTTAEDITAFVRIGVYSGSVVSGTLQFALYEGSVAYPPVPYNHVGLWAMGRNLLDPSVAFGGSSQYTVNADGSVTVSADDSRAWTSMPIVFLAAGTYTMVAEGNDGGYVRFNVVDGGAETAKEVAGNNPITFTLTSGGGVKVKVNRGTFPRTVRLSLCIGSAAHAYEPYADSITSVPLDGHALRSLPDGTRDEVTVDQYGHVTLVERVGSVDLGTLTWLVQTGATNVWRMVSGTLRDQITPPANNNTKANVMCTSYPTMTANETYLGNVGVSLQTGNGIVHVFNSTYNSESADPAAFKTAMSGVELIYPLAESVTHDLGTIDPTALVGPDMTAQAVPTAPFALTYERDLNTTLARLEAAIAALA